MRIWHAGKHGRRRHADVSNGSYGNNGSDGAGIPWVSSSNGWKRRVSAARRRHCAGIDSVADATGSCNRRRANTDWLTPCQIEAGWLAGWLVGLGKLIAIYVPWHFCVWPSDWCRERSVCCRYLCFSRKMQIVHPNDGNLIRSLIGHSTPQAINTRQLA